MKKTLEEIAGYQEPAHLIKTIKELEAKVAKLEDDLHTANEKSECCRELARADEARGEQIDERLSLPTDQKDPYSYS